MFGAWGGTGFPTLGCLCRTVFGTCVACNVPIQSEAKFSQPETRPSTQKLMRGALVEQVLKLFKNYYRITAMIAFSHALIA